MEAGRGSRHRPLATPAPADAVVASWASRVSRSSRRWTVPWSPATRRNRSCAPGLQTSPPLQKRVQVFGGAQDRGGELFERIQQRPRSGGKRGLGLGIGLLPLGDLQSPPDLALESLDLPDDLLLPVAARPGREPDLLHFLEEAGPGAEQAEHLLACASTRAPARGRWRTPTAGTAGPSAGRSPRSWDARARSAPRSCTTGTRRGGSSRRRGL